MKVVLALVLICSSVAHAGWWKDFCERRLDARDDEYRKMPDEILNQRIEELETNPTIDPSQSMVLAIMRHERMQRYEERMRNIWIKSFTNEHLLRGKAELEQEALRSKLGMNILDWINAELKRRGQ